MTPESPKIGLRELKKERTRRLIRHHTLRLVGEQGYAGTTVEQIAAACEIAPSTFFRYFKNKDEAIAQDFMDRDVFERMRVEPIVAGESIMSVLKRVVTAVYTELSDEEWAEERERMRLIQSIPELRSVGFEEMSRPLRYAFDFIAERVGLPTEHPMVRAYGGAILGGMSAIATQPEGSEVEFAYPQTREELIAQFGHFCDVVDRLVVMPPELAVMVDAQQLPEGAQH